MYSTIYWGNISSLFCDKLVNVAQPLNDEKQSRYCSDSPTVEAEIKHVARACSSCINVSSRYTGDTKNLQVSLLSATYYPKMHAKACLSCKAHKLVLRLKGYQHFWKTDLKCNRQKAQPKTKPDTRHLVLQLLVVEAHCQEGIPYKSLHNYFGVFLLTLFSRDFLLTCNYTACTIFVRNMR